MFARLKEGSSWASIAAVLGTMASMFPPAAPYLTAAAAVAGAIGYAIPDKAASK